jgi:hypothetical protein
MCGHHVVILLSKVRLYFNLLGALLVIGKGEVLLEVLLPKPGI